MELALTLLFHDTGKIQKKRVLGILRLIVKYEQICRLNTGEQTLSNTNPRTRFTSTEEEIAPRGNTVRVFRSGFLIIIFIILVAHRFC